MAYIIMAIQEEGSEIRISDWDVNERGFDSRENAVSFLDIAREHYPEFRSIWVEENRDADYWYEYYARQYWEDGRDYADSEDY